MFQKELRSITPEATLSSCFERVFMLALRYTNNRIMNWVACRSILIDKRYVGPQHVGHRLHKDLHVLEFALQTLASEMAQ